MMPGTRSVYFLYSTGSMIRDRATQYAGMPSLRATPERREPLRMRGTIPPDGGRQWFRSCPARPFSFASLAFVDIEQADPKNWAHSAGMLARILGGKSMDRRRV